MNTSVFHPFRKQGACALIIGLYMWAPIARAQTAGTITLDSCYAWSERNYPLLRQGGTIDLSESLSLENISRGNLPKLMVGGQATYQSEVTRVPFDVPGTNIPVLSKDQYKIYGEVNQALTPLFTSGNQKEVTRLSAALERQQLAVDAFQLHQRVNELFLGILLIDEQARQLELTASDLQLAEEAMKTAHKNGVRTLADVDQIHAEIISLNQRKTELKTTRIGLVEALKVLTGKELAQDIVPQLPASTTSDGPINRPEMHLLNAQRDLLTAQHSLLKNKTLPQFNLFLQGGYGRPALNMLSNDFDFYYIGGLRLNWSIGNYYTLSREKQLLTLKATTVDLQKESFEQSVQLSLTKQRAEITKFETLLQSDDELIEIRERLSGYSRVQLDNGTNTVNDFVTAVNAEDKARQSKSVHQMQLLMAKIQYAHILGYE